jgi:predicted small secreted protein
LRLRWPRAAALVVAIAMLLAACSNGGGGVKRDKNGQVTSAGGVSVFDLRPGDCIVPPTDVKAEIQTVLVVPCSTKHTQEAYAIEAYDRADAYPGDQALTSFADGACLGQYQDYVGVAYQDSKLFYTYLLPSARSWNEGKDRKVVCIITTTGQELTASVKGSKQ